MLDQRRRRGADVFTGLRHFNSANKVLKALLSKHKTSIALADPRGRGGGVCVCVRTPLSTLILTK